MRRKGFTLIELLAVIVILAIIALIATPIVLNIIENTKEEANERSIDMYAHAVNNAVLAYELKNKKAPLYFSEIEEYIDYDGATVVCSSKTLNNDKSITLSGCTLNGSTTKYKYENGKVEEEEEVEPDPICTIEQQDDSKYSVGDVITCELAESTDTFYVIEEASLTATTLKTLTEMKIRETDYRQSEEAGPVSFSSTEYWEDDELSEGEIEGETYTYADVYDNRNDVVKTIVDGYVSYLNNTLTIDAIGRLMTHEEAWNLDIRYYDVLMSSGSSSIEWIENTGFWWLGFVLSDLPAVVYYGDAIPAIDIYGDIEAMGPDVGVRPVIVFSTNDIGIEVY